MTMPRDRPNGIGEVPSAAGGIARLVCERFQSEGRSVDSFLAMVGISHRQIADPSVRIDAVAEIRLLATAAAALSDDLLGFRLARDFELRRIGLIYYIMASARDLPSAFLGVQRYSRIVNEGVRALYRAEAMPVITVDYGGLADLYDPQHAEFWLTTLLRIGRQISGIRIAPVAMRMRHSRERTPEEMRTFFGIEPEFGAAADEIVLPPAAASVTLAGADPHLNEMLLGFADRALADLGELPPGMHERVERLLPCLLPHGRTTAADIARELGVSRRTLSRLLSAEGDSLPKIMERVRTALAISYLEDGRIPISEIAWLLGYREVSSFTNAFRGWTGSTPSEVRAGARPARS